MRILLLLAARRLVAAGCGDKPVEKAPAPRDPLAITANAELAARLQTAAPAFAEVSETLRVSGRIEADETRLARVGSPVTGRITDLEAREGDSVRRGQVLATINSTELSGAQLGFLKATSQRGLAARAAARAQQLLDADVIGAAELQRRQAELAQAEAEVNAARDQLKVLGMSRAALEPPGRDAHHQFGHPDRRHHRRHHHRAQSHRGPGGAAGRRRVPDRRPVEAVGRRRRAGAERGQRARGRGGLGRDRRAARAQGSPAA